MRIKKSARPKIEVVHLKEYPLIEDESSLRKRAQKNGSFYALFRMTGVVSGGE